MPMRNDANRYGLVAIALHWLAAIAILAMLGTAGWIWATPDDPTEGQRIQLHASLGTLLYVIVAARILWSWIERKPKPLQPPGGLTTIAPLVHLTLLLLVALQLITGPLNVWSGGWPVSAFGLFTIDSPWDSPRDWHDLIGNLHSYSGYAIAGLVALHIAAAMKHQFVDRDETLGRMFGLEPQAGT